MIRPQRRNSGSEVGCGWALPVFVQDINLLSIHMQNSNVCNLISLLVDHSSLFSMHCLNVIQTFELLSDHE